LEILRPLLKQVKTLSYIVGLKIVLAGRLTRKERAAFMIRKYGSVPLSKKDAIIDYAADSCIMKFGVVGVKVWLQMTTRSTPSFYYFAYNFNKNFLKDGNR
jgi:ribosomal protein S3